MDSIESLIGMADRATEQMQDALEAARRVERVDTLHAIARYLNFKGEHAAAQMIRTELDVFRFMRASPRHAQHQQPTEKPQ